MKSISIVGSELQFLNAYEALKEYKCKENILVLSSFNARIGRIYELLSQQEIRDQFQFILKLRMIPCNGRVSNFMNAVFFRIQLYFLQLKKVDYCIIGNYNEMYHRYLACKLEEKGAKIVEVDDGLNIGSIVNFRKEDLQGNFSNHYPLSFFKKVFFFNRKKTVYVPLQITFFSSLVSNPSFLGTKDLCVINKRLHFKDFSQYSLSLEVDAIIFIGQPYIESNMMNKKDYFTYLKSVSLRYPKRKIYYFPHPLESNLKEIAKALSMYVIKKINFPIELLLNSLTKTNIIIGFSSTVLLFFADQNSFSVFYIKPKSSDFKDCKEAMSQCYHDFFDHDERLKIFNPLD